MAKNRNSGLGRGLDAIFLDNAGEEPKSGVTMLRVSEIEPRPDQPRKNFESEAIASLADSIAEKRSPSAASCTLRRGRFLSDNCR